MHFLYKGFALKARRPQQDRRLRVGLEIAALALLVPAAVFFWTAPRRQEIALQHATLTALTDELRKQPENPRVAYYLGLRLRDAGRTTEAQAAFKRAAERDIDDEDLWLAWASTQGGSRPAIDILTLFLAKNPHSARAHLMLAETYEQNRAYKRAYEEASVASRLAPHNADALRVLGVNAMAWSPTVVAVAALRRAVALRPDDWRNQIALGDALSQTGRRSDALANFQAATRLAPTQAVAFLSLGRCLLLPPTTPEDREAARRSLERSAALAPAIPLARLLLGQAYVQQQAWSKARVSLELARRLAPDDDKIAFELARVYRRSGDVTAAREELGRHRHLLVFKSKTRLLKERILQNPGDSRLRLQLARLYAAYDDDAAAAEQYRQILGREPGSADARRELARIESRNRTSNPPLSPAKATP